MNIITGLRNTLGRCSFNCETDTVKEINFNGVRVRLCENCAERLAGALSQVEQPDSAAPNENYCALNTISDDQVRKVIRAFWRRIYPYRNDYEIELPNPIPVEFMSFMATALTWVDKPAHKPQRITEQDLFAIIDAYNNGSSDDSDTAWISVGGRTLIAKLNEHRKPDYKAMFVKFIDEIEHYEQESEFDAAIKNARTAIAQCEGESNERK